jgi:dolichol-phosphate mannosyltransferase
LESTHKLDRQFAIIIPLANEAKDFTPFITELKIALKKISHAKIFLIVDRASIDNTLFLCRELSQQDSRFITIWAPENKNVVDAYLRGFKEAYAAGFEWIIEMDAGLSHQPKDLLAFINELQKGYDCVFGSRHILGGSNSESPLFRRFLSKGGTMLSNVFLGTRLKDMTSGFQGFHRQIVEKFMNYPFLSIAHFYQTELRYLLRDYKSIEVPIQYASPSPRVNWKSIINSIRVLSFYAIKKSMRQEIRL